MVPSEDGTSHEVAKLILKKKKKQTCPLILAVKQGLSFSATPLCRLCLNVLVTFNEQPETIFPDTRLPGEHTY